MEWNFNVDIYSINKLDKIKTKKTNDIFLQNTRTSINCPSQEQHRRCHLDSKQQFIYDKNEMFDKRLHNINISVIVF